MEKVEVFELEDDFDPLADAGLELETDDEYAGGIEYQAPIPDADKSVVPEAVELPPAERIDKLVAGIPGQKFRILSAIKICGEPKTLEVAADELEEAYPQGTSVYDAIRIIELLHDAGALVCVDEEGNEIDLDAVAEEADEAPAADAGAAVAAVADAAEEAAEEARVDAISLDELDVEYDEVEKEAPVFYLATDRAKTPSSACGAQALRSMRSITSLSTFPFGRRFCRCAARRAAPPRRPSPMPWTRIRFCRSRAGGASTSWRS